MWSGVKTRYRKKSVLWDGNIFVKNGKIVDVEDYAIDKVTEGVISHNSHIVNFKSKTSGDEDGLIMNIIPKDNCRILFNSTQKNIEINLDELSESPTEYYVGPENMKVEAVLDSEKIDSDDFSKYDYSFSFIDDEVEEGMNSYYFKAIQKDGNRAWASPIFVDYSKC